MDTYEKIVSTWKKLDIKNSAQLEAELNGYIVKFAYHSGKIENDAITFNDTREIFDKDGVVNYTGDLRTLFEIRNAKEASNFILESFDTHTPIDKDFVLGLQFLLTQNTYDARRWSLGERPGTYKQHDYVTGRFEVGVYPEDVPKAMDELFEELKNTRFSTPSNVLIGAAYLHAKFEQIHPFADGNGRTGRLLMNYLLLQNNHPPLIIHEEDRKLYYASLEAFDTKEDLSPLCLFLKAEVVKTFGKSRFLRKGGFYP